jgi:hypothetical protein
VRKITLFVAGVVVFVLLSIDTYACIRTLGPGSVSAGHFNPLIDTPDAKGLPCAMMTTCSGRIE